MTKQARSAKDVVHVRHEERVIHRGRQLNVAKVAWAREVSQVTCCTTRFTALAHLSQCTKSKALTYPGEQWVQEQDRTDRLHSACSSHLTIPGSKSV